MYLKTCFTALLCWGLVSCSNSPSSSPVKDNSDIDNKAPADTSMPMQQKRLEGELERDNRAKCGYIRCPAPSPLPTTNPTP